MNRKIIISSLILLFLISTTGLPVFSRYCEIMGEKSLSECEVCSSEEVEVVSCCSEETPENELKVYSENSTCCVYEFDYKKIDDKFFHTISSNPISKNLIVADIQLTSLNSQDEEQYSQKTNYDLPPPKFGKQLLHTIHQLKIDLPVC